ncbi:MAG: hypothetical protein IT167_30965 [Bryobacterales bacterium]|nr:hypothetical protein [Bryobacterales bacterium]
MRGTGDAAHYRLLALFSACKNTMWPYLVGIQLYNPLYRPLREAQLSRLGAIPLIDNVWLVYGDYSAEALKIFLQTLLDDLDQFFVAPVDEDFTSHNLPVRKV